MPRKKGGLGGLNIPLIADVSKQLSRDYGCLIEGGITLRGLFIIDGEGTIRHITKNDPPVGRSIDEVLRVVQAYQYTDEHGEVCPANWTPGKPTMVDDPKVNIPYATNAEFNSPALQRGLGPQKLGLRHAAMQ